MLLNDGIITASGETVATLDPSILLYFILNGTRPLYAFTILFETMLLKMIFIDTVIDTINDIDSLLVNKFFTFLFVDCKHYFLIIHFAELFFVV